VVPAITRASGPRRGIAKELVNAWGDDQPNYTVKAAAKRVERSTRTIERWIRDGMTCRNVAGIIVIDDPVLMKYFRERMLSNPNRKTRTDISEISSTMS